ncbi:MAG: redoxin domain-containing protein [Clostridiales bacterium]|nr:redoxin domain-containing protein [Clostridiales bacterium]
MGDAFKPGCRPPVPQVKSEETQVEVNLDEKVEKRGKSMIKVGHPAPDFTLNAYHKGEFKQFSLSEFKGKWVMLCFYPGDFTFV